jgi:hypothetical protein
LVYVPILGDHLILKGNSAAVSEFDATKPWAAPAPLTCLPQTVLSEIYKIHYYLSLNFDQAT